MRRDASNISQFISKPLPFIEGGYVTIYARERLYLQVQIEGERLKPVEVVPFIKNPAQTLILQLRQPAYVNTGIYRGPGGMLFTIFNPFSEPLVFKTAILPADKTEPQTAFTCAVLPRTSGYEVWSFPVSVVWLTDLHLVARSAAIPCH